MHEPSSTQSGASSPTAAAATTAPHPDAERIYPLRSLIGGVLMGFANILPGISGGAMLLLIGVYQRFIQAVADVSTLKLRWRSLVFLGLIACGAFIAILFSAGPIKAAILEHRWQLFSLFIGLRLGAIPLVMRWAKPFDRNVVIGIVAGLIITVALALTQYTGGSSAPAGTGQAAGGGGQSITVAHTSTPLSRFGAGLAGASATILPGMDGSYFLLLMGEYVPILSGIDNFKQELLAFNIKGMWNAGLYLLPVALGVALGLAGVSNLMRWAFAKHRGLIAGILLGVLVGAVGGLWPFREGVPPVPGDVIRGIVVTDENKASFDPEDYRMAFFTPSPTQIAASVGLVLLGIAIAYGMSKLDPEERNEPEPPAATKA
jgi:putative membrane protein